MKIFNGIKTIFRPFIKGAVHAGGNIVLNATLGALTKETPFKSDDYLFESYLKPETHNFIDLAFDGFKGIKILTYFGALKDNLLKSINNIELLKALDEDINGRIKELERATLEEKTK